MRYNVLFYSHMDYSKPIPLYEGEKFITLKQENIIRIALVLLSPAIQEFKDTKHSESLTEFMDWIKKELHMNEGKVLL